MPRQLLPGRRDGRTTDHGDEIHGIRAQSTRLGSGSAQTRRRLDAARELLEHHDATLISLEQMPACADLVNNVMSYMGYAPYLPNGV